MSDTDLTTRIDDASPSALRESGADVPRDGEATSAQKPAAWRVIVSPWILSVLTTDRLARNYELVTKHNLKYRRYYHQFDY